MIENIDITGTPAEVSSQIFERYGNIATRIAPSIFSGDPEIISEIILNLRKNL